jgi:single-stranded DNA-specific DHH superfamily exonuclease
MLKDIIDKEFYDQLKNGARRILNEDYVRVLAHYDGDGTSSAIILTNALKRKDIKFHLGYIKALDGESFRKRIEEDDITTIVVDAGSDQVQYVPEYEKIIVLDHHFFNRTTIKGININARDYNVDGTREACGATMAFLMALAMDEANADLLPFFVAGAIADKQDMGGFHGLNRKLVEAYGSKSHVFRGINLEGGNLIDSITYSTDEGKAAISCDCGPEPSCGGCPVCRTVGTSWSCSRSRRTDGRGASGSEKGS